MKASHKFMHAYDIGEMKRELSREDRWWFSNKRTWKRGIVVT
jgi:hypothetical protein